MLLSIWADFSSSQHNRMEEIFVAILNPVNTTEARRAVKREIALAQLEEYHIVVPAEKEHFDYGNGWHGLFYLNPHELFRFPSRIWRLGQDLLDAIPLTVLNQVEVVGGPVFGGAILAHTIAGLLDGRQDIKHPPIEFARFAPKGRSGPLELNVFYGKVVTGKNVLLADDVLNTGKTLHRCIELVNEAGGRVIGAAVMFDRMEMTERLPKGIELFPMARFRAPANVPAENCPYCKLGMPIKKF